MIYETLNIFGIEDEDILSEDFELNINDKDLKDVVDSQVTLIENNNCIKVNVSKGKSILDGFLDVNYDLPYSCQTGSCNTCKAKLKSGTADMIGIKRRDELKDGEILLCCSFPTSDRIEIEI